MWCVAFVFFFKQKTAYEMRISDWSSDVCSSDLKGEHAAGRWLLAHRAVTEDGPGGNAAAGQRIQSLPVDHQVAVVLDDVGRLEITDIEIGRASCRERVCQYV